MAATDKINKKVIFKLPRGAAVPLWVYLKSSGQLQYIITNQREGGRRAKLRGWRVEIKGSREERGMDERRGRWAVGETRGR